MNNIKVGRERDIQIAELKGGKVSKRKFRTSSRATPRYRYMVWYKGKSTKGLPYYSTMPNGCAEKETWNLWHDLPKNKKYVEFSNGKTIIAFQFKGMIDWTIIEGKDFADCVSAAYVKWRLNE